MNIILERILKLMNDKNISISDMCKFAQIPQSTFSTWKSKDREPQTKYLNNIANVLDVTVDYLITGENEEEKYYLNPETSKIAQEIFDNPEMHMLFKASRNASPEDLKTVTEMMLALKRKEKGEDDF